MAYFVTGATGFIGRRLVERLLEKRQGKVYVLVRESSTGRLDDLIERWTIIVGAVGRRAHRAGDRRPAPAAAGRREGTGGGAARQGQPLLPSGRRLRHDGARRAQHGRQRRRHHARGRTRARGRRQAPAPRLLDRRRGHLQGRVRRGACSTRARGCPRPTTAPSSSPSGSCASSRTCPGGSTGRGSSSATPQTGEMDKIDGPYYFFKAIQRMRHLLPEWVPLVGLDLGYTNVVPVDWVAGALEHIAHEPDLDGRAFHLTDPRPQRVDELINELAARRARAALRRQHRQTAHRPAAQVAAARWRCALPPLRQVARPRAARARHPRGGARAHGARAAASTRARPRARSPARRSSSRRR